MTEYHKHETRGNGDNENTPARKPRANDILHAKFKVPDGALYGKINTLFVSPGDKTGLVMLHSGANENFSSVELDSLSRHKNPSPTHLRQMLEAECKRLRWSPKAIVLESPMPQAWRRWGSPAAIVSKGVELFARRCLIFVRKASLEDAARLFGAEGATTPEVISAVRRRFDPMPRKALRAIAVGCAANWVRR